MGKTKVALPAEGVDRNSISFLSMGVMFSVALPAEGVDRNSASSPRASSAVSWSPSPRRAWIEIRWGRSA